MENGKTGRIAYSYTPEDWSQEEFLRLGGFTAVCLNYNQLKYIEKSVAAALAQDFPRLEMFFMDNASTDGSGDLMEKLVRAYRGRHKVTVVRNEINVYITGQWNIVSKLATGNWFGMFCGDDVSHPDRVSLVAERIRQNPSLRAISTACIDVTYNAKTGQRHILPCSQFSSRVVLLSGDCANPTGVNCYGATAFWHRTLFAEPIPKVPYDDGYLQFRTFIINRNSSLPVYCYDGSIQTVDYAVGTGVSAQGVENCEEGEMFRNKWYRERLRFKRFLKASVLTLESVVDYGKSKSVDGTFLSVLTKKIWLQKVQAATTFERLFLLPAFLAFLCHSVSNNCERKRCLKSFFHYFVIEFFGLRIASFLRSMIGPNAMGDVDLSYCSCGYKSNG